MADKKRGVGLILVIVLAVAGIFLFGNVGQFSILDEGEFNSNSDCTFITNANYGANGEQISDYSSGSYISVDWNGDGTLEGYGYTGSSSATGDICASKRVITTTPAGLDVVAYQEVGGVKEVRVCSGTETKNYKETDSDAQNAILYCGGDNGGSDPVCGNGICESGETESSCSADCGTDDGGNGGDTIVVPANPSFDDLISYAQRWVNA